MRKQTIGLLPLLVLGASATAQAQQAGFALDRFAPAEAGSRWLMADSLNFGDHALYRKAPKSTLETLVLKLGANVADDPLVIGKDGSVKTKVVSLQSTATLGASITLADRLRVGAVIPLQLYAVGSRGADGAYAYNSPASAFALGDVRLGVHYRLLGDVGDKLRLAIGATGYAPTGDANAYAGAGRWRGEPQLLGAGDLGPIAWALSGAVPFAGKDAYGNVNLGRDVVATAAIGYLTEDKKFLIGPEVRVVSSLEAKVFARRTSTYEPMVGAHYGVAEGWRLHAGVGTGIGEGLGSPRWRGSFAVEWAPVAPAAEVPPPPPPPPAPRSDRDGDGIWDEDDACPDVTGEANEDKSKHGCPPPPPPRSDRDGDGIWDEDDACPDVKGEANEDKSKHGCPPPPPPPVVAAAPVDTDGDGIFDPEDACPTEPGPKHPDPKKHGCPVGALVAGELVLDNVRFKSDSDVILPESDETLSKVLATIQKLAPEQRFLVEGHTDSRGNANWNLDLSARRAKSVIRWFASKGIAAARFDSKGYGQDRPIATNDTDEGRKSNRRVEIHLVDAAKK
jgi:OOP family OmpA-OmpF porin